MKSKNIFSNIEAAIKDIKDGKMIIVVDDPARENEGDLVCAAQKITPKIINFMITYGRGLVCAPVESSRLEELGIENMIANPTEKKGCCFTVSLDYKVGTTTGISAYDRAKTIKKLIDKNAKAQDFAMPGHIFPLRSRLGGVLTRAGHTEAAVDLARLAKLAPAGVICEIIKDDGSMARLPDLAKFAKKHKLKIITIADLIKYRASKDNALKEVAAVDFPTAHGHFKLKVFEDALTKENILAIIKGDIKGKNNVLTRLHSSCETGDIFHSLRCDCGEQLKKSLELIEKEGRGIVLYLHQEGRGIGLVNKIKAYALQEKGLDTVEANTKLGFAPDLRDYSMAAKVLSMLGVKSMRLMTNNPQKIAGLESCGLKVERRVALEVKPVKTNKKYLTTKKTKMQHLLHLK
jgi:3,4-dihydroxy 2-butanone 4-phosphate synthase/GTP cyclohydrolase II